MTAFYPSMVVNFRLRFDEAILVAPVPDPLPQTGASAAELVQAAVSKINALGEPLFLAGAGDNLSHVFDCIPKTATIELPGFRQAGHFNLSFDFRDLLIDPRLLRAIGVEIHLGLVEDSDFGRGMTASASSGRRTSILNTQDHEPILVGVIDTWAVEHDEKSSTITMEGRDLRGIFLDSPLDPNVVADLDLTQNIVTVVTAIVSRHPYGERVTVKYYDNDWKGNKIPSPAVEGGLTRVRRRANGRGQRSQPAGDASKLSYWDLITQYCLLVGAIPMFEGQDLVVRPGRSLFDQQKALSQRSPFRFGGDPDSVRERFDDGEPFVIRKMIYGRNIRKLAFERKYAGTRAQVVQVVSVDTSSSKRGTGKLLVVEWPQEADKKARTTGVSPSGAQSSTEKIRISVPGIRDKEQLLAIAQDIFEEIGRGEMGGSCETNDLNSFGDDTGLDADMLRIRPGNAVEFITDTRQLSLRVPLVAELVEHGRRSFEEEVAVVTAQLAIRSGGADPNFARAVVASARSSLVELLRFFRVANVKYDWSSESGIGVAFDFQNYIVARSGVTKSVGPEIVPPRRLSAGKKKTQPKQTKHNASAQPTIPKDARARAAQLAAQQRRLAGGG